ncbi:MAG: BREX system Lon protease-like protein BrxL [Clostridium sp.]
MNILIKKSKVKELENLEYDLQHFNLAEKELIIANNLLAQVKEFPIKDAIEFNKIMSKKKVITLIISITHVDLKKRIVKISGADLELDFFIAKNEVEKIRTHLKKKRILAELRIRQHENNIFFIEKVTIVTKSKEENYSNIIELRKNYTTDKWKNLILNTVGYDLKDSKSILKDLMIVRLIPYLEKNYGYIEFGGFSTGKTTMAELFSNSEKIASNISEAQLIYNVNKSKEGLLFSKDVLYLDESDFSVFNQNIATALLQALAGNEVQVRDKSDAKKSNISIISQGNIGDGIADFMSGKLFKRFEKSFNASAFLDRKSFFIAGWLIPPYSKIKIEEDCDVIPLSILEDFFKVQRDKKNYSNMVEGLDINLTGSESEGRFIESVKKTISGFLKLIYPEKNIDFEVEKEEIKKIILLSILGKFAIAKATADLEGVNFQNNTIEVSWKNMSLIKINKRILINDYIKSREEKYFKKESLIITKDEKYTSPWENENISEMTEEDIIFEEKCEKVEITENLKNLLLRINDIEIKNNCIEYYKFIEAFSFNQTNEKQPEFFEKVSFFLGILWSYSQLILENSEKKIIRELLRTIEKKENYTNYSNPILALLNQSPSDELEAVKKIVKKINENLENTNFQKDIKELEKIFNDNLKKFIVNRYSLNDLKKILGFN